MSEIMIVLFDCIKFLEQFEHYSDSISILAYYIIDYTKKIDLIIKSVKPHDHIDAKLADCVALVFFHFQHEFLICLTDI